MFFYLLYFLLWKMGTGAQPLNRGGASNRMVYCFFFCVGGMGEVEEVVIIGVGGG